MQFKLDESDGLAQLVWPSNRLVLNDDCVRIIVGDRCNCYNRRAFDGQCHHELRLNHTFKMDHWNFRWLQESEYNIEHPSITSYQTLQEPTMLQAYDQNASTNKSTSNLAESIDNEHSNTIIDIDVSDEEFVERDSLIENDNSTVNYKDVLDVATELCRTVSNDPKLAKSTYCLLHEWARRIRIDKNTQVNFVAMSYNCANKDNTQDTIVPIPATVTLQDKRKRDSRFISSLEAQRTFGVIKRKNYSQKTKR